MAEARKQPELEPAAVADDVRQHPRRNWSFQLDRAKAKELGPQPVSDVFATMQVYLGSLYTSTTSTCSDARSTLPRPGRRERRGPTRSISPAFSCRTATGGLLPLNAIGTLVPIDRARDGAALQPVWVRADQRWPGGGRELRPGDRGHAARRNRVCRTGSAYEWTGVIYQQLKAGSAATLIFGLALVFVFLSLAAPI